LNPTCGGSNPPVSKNLINNNIIKTALKYKSTSFFIMSPSSNGRTVPFQGINEGSNPSGDKILLKFMKKHMSP
jgi:hypothetical protein